MVLYTIHLRCWIENYGGNNMSIVMNIHGSWIKIFKKVSYFNIVNNNTVKWVLPLKYIKIYGKTKRPYKPYFFRWLFLRCPLSKCLFTVCLFVVLTCLVYLNLLFGHASWAWQSKQLFNSSPAKNKILKEQGTRKNLKKKENFNTIKR